jgi:hypothetical protein
MADELPPLSPPTSDPGKQRNLKVPLIAGGAVALLALAFWFQNGGRKDTEVDFLIFEKFTTVRWVVLISLILGVLLDRFGSMWWRRRREKKQA